MPTPPLPQKLAEEALDLVKQHGGVSAAARASGIARTTLRYRYNYAKKQFESHSLDYDLERAPPTPSDAWNSHVSAFEQKASKMLKEHKIKRDNAGAFVIFHSTDEHIDDDGTPLRLIEADVKASHDLGAIMCHGGDAVNNWPMNGRLAKQWAQQECTAPGALLRLQHFIDIFKPDVWIDGNHEEMNPYLETLIDQWLPDDVIRDYWTARFTVQSPQWRDIRVGLSHKFQKGSSWFHKMHGHIREMLEGVELDMMLDGHLHSDGMLDHTLPERSHSALCVASAGYKLFDKFAMRISRDGPPKMRGRAHWIVCDPQAESDEALTMGFVSARQAEACLNGLQNLRAA